MATRRSDASRLRIPPHSIDAESRTRRTDDFAGSVGRVADKLVEEDFYQREHRAIFRAIAELSAKSVPCDAVTLAEWFEANGIAELVGGAGYVVRLANAVPSAANIVAYAEIVRQGLAAPPRASQRRDRHGRLAAADRQRRRRDRGSRAAAVPDCRAALAWSRRPEGRCGEREARLRADPASSPESGRRHRPPHGFTKLDQVLVGLQPSDLVVIAARPSMGKTALALNMTEHASVRLGITSVVFSMEMASVQLTMRLLSSLGGINQKRLMMADLFEDEWPRLTDAITRLRAAPLYLDETPALSPLELASRARRLKREHNLGLVVVDYLQLMRAPAVGENRKHRDRRDLTRPESRAKELNVPVITLSQLNRALERRDDKRPVMSDLRESGAIEQDADVILFIYRDEKYNANSDKKGQAEVIIGKHRNGDTGTVELLFRGDQGAVPQHGLRLAVIAAHLVCRRQVGHDTNPIRRPRHSGLIACSVASRHTTTSTVGACPVTAHWRKALATSPGVTASRRSSAAHALVTSVVASPATHAFATKARRCSRVR